MINRYNSQIFFVITKCVAFYLAAYSFLISATTRTTHD